MSPSRKGYEASPVGVDDYARRALPPERDPTTCRCGPQWRKPKANGTCATCGGWLPGEK